MRRFFNGSGAIEFFPCDSVLFLHGAGSQCYIPHLFCRGRIVPSGGV